MLARPLLRTQQVTLAGASGTLTPGAISTLINDSLYNSWPSACRMSDDSLIAVYAQSNGHNIDNSGVIRAILGNAGATSWGSAATIASDPPYGQINPGVGNGSSGRVIATYNYFDFPIENPDYVRVKYSDDFGATFSAMYTIDSTFSSWNANGGQPVKLADGTVLVSFYGLDIGGSFASSHLVRSSDNGETFGTETVIADGDADGRPYYEPALLVLDTGDLLCLMRTSGGTGDIRQFRSTDDGATWTDEGVAFGGYSTPNAIQMTTRTLVATVRGNASGQLEVFSSIDFGATWVSQGDFDSGFTELQYACPLQLASGDGLIVYSVQPTASTSNADIKQIYFTEAA